MYHVEQHARQKRKSKTQALQKPAKKLKKNSADHDTEDAVSVNETAPQAAKTNLNDLDWKAVPAQGRLDDYEGFFGLEEIDGVDVIRDENGMVSFSSTGGRPLDSQGPQKRNQKSGARKEASKQRRKSLDAPDPNGWEGFSDTPARIDVPPTQAATSASKERTAAHAPSQSDGNPFDLLQELDAEAAEVDLSAWNSLNLSNEALNGLARLQFSHPTPIQASAIPIIMRGEDIIGKAPTGSGKTLAFGIPLFEKWLASSLKGQIGDKENKSGHALALIIEPTRELAHQIKDHLNAFFDGIPGETPAVMTITGGLSMLKQKRLFARAQIVIATPGRLWEFMSEAPEHLSKLKGIKTLIVDEADRLLAQGNFRELEEVFAALHRRESTSDVPTATTDVASSWQTSVFSATFDRELQANLARKRFVVNSKDRSKTSMAYLLQKLHFRARPKFVDVSPAVSMPRTLREGLLEVPVGTEKDLYLYAFLLLYRPQAFTKTIVFVNAISAVRRLAPFLQLLGFQAVPLHSNMIQKARLRSIERFTGKKSAPRTTKSILVATDVAARGLDIPKVDAIVHYNVPRSADAYVHRSGRTARAEESGVSVLLCASQEANSVRRLVAQVHAQAVGSASRHELKTIDLDKQAMLRVKPRALLAKKIADTELVRSKDAGASRRKNTVEDEPGDRDDPAGESEEESGLEESGRRGKGRQRRLREVEARSLSRAELQRAKAELQDMLSQRVNLGVSERYLASGAVDMKALLEQRQRQGGVLTTGFLGDLASVSIEI